MSQNLLSVTANDDGQRLDKYLRKIFPQLPLSIIYKYLREKRVKVFRGTKKFHGKRTTILEKGDKIKLYFDTQQFGDAPPEEELDYKSIVSSRFFEQHFSVNYEDQYFFIANKSAGIAVHPGSKTPTGKSLIDLYVAHVLGQNPQVPEPKLAHRLDKDTSGLILISKNDGVLRKITKLIRNGNIEKKYLALVKGKVTPKSGEITESLIRTEGSKYTKIQVSQKKNAQESRTRYTVREYFSERDASLVEIQLDTGRMHQIRVHFASQGHPLAGDPAYGDFAWNKALRKQYGLKRQFLHACQLAFIHPETKESMRFESDLPEDLKKILLSG